MKLKLKDKVIVIKGRDHGKTGEVIAVLPKDNQVVVEGINTVKRHTKPNAKQSKGGIVELTKPIDASKVMVVDPATGRAARVGYKTNKNGGKERVFKVSKFANAKVKPVAKLPVQPAKKNDKVKK